MHRTPDPRRPRARGWGLVALVALGGACFIDQGGATGVTASEGGSSSAASTTEGDPTSEGSTSTLGTTGTSAESTATTTSTATTDTSEATSMSTSTTTTTTTSTSTTEGPLCAAPGAACDGMTPCCGSCSVCGDKGVCVADSGLCGTCETCGALGACEPALPGSACGEPFDCTTLVWGEKGGICYAIAGVIEGACTPEGTCAAADPKKCATQGPVVYACPECVLPEHNCTYGVQAAEITANSLCHTSGQTALCDDLCINDAFQSKIDARACSADGTCDSGPKTMCGDYKCDPVSNACYNKCNADSECTFTNVCVDGVCQ
ncbi:MAG: hypothetical protein R3B09_07280 [Nannocystaceae bacterium]